MGLAALLHYVDTDHGAQFTKQAYLDAVHSSGVEVSMDGRRWMDNRFVERLWEIFLQDYLDCLLAGRQISRFTRNQLGKSSPPMPATPHLRISTEETLVRLLVVQGTAILSPICLANSHAKAPSLIQTSTLRPPRK